MVPRSTNQLKSIQPWPSPAGRAFTDFSACPALLALLLDAFDPRLVFGLCFFCCLRSRRGCSLCIDLRGHRCGRHRCLRQNAAMGVVIHGVPYANHDKLQLSRLRSQQVEASLAHLLQEQCQSPDGFKKNYGTLDVRRLESCQAFHSTSNKSEITLNL